MHEEVEHALVELARGHGVQHDDAQHLARAGGHRDGDHRLEVLLLELGHVLHARVRQRVLADERGLAGPCDPACQPLVEGELDLAHHVGVDARRGADPQPVSIAQVDEAGMAARRLGDELDDAVEHLGQVDRRADGADDRVQRVALEPYPLELCREVAAAGATRSILPAYVPEVHELRPKWWPQADIARCARHWIELSRPRGGGASVAVERGLDAVVHLRPGQVAGPSGTRAVADPGLRRPRRAVLLLHRRPDVADPRGLHVLRGRRRPPQERHGDGDEEHPDDRRRHADLLLLRLVGLQLQPGRACRSGPTPRTSPRSPVRAASRGATPSGRT